MKPTDHSSSSAGSSAAPGHSASASAPPLRPNTLLGQLGRSRDRDFDFVNPPLVRGSTVLHDDVADLRKRVHDRLQGIERPVAYGIYGSPTHHAFYDALTALEGGHASWALPSGLAACTLAILAFVKTGDHVLVPDSVYWPTRRFCRQTLARMGVSTTFYDVHKTTAELATLFRPTTRVLFMESPGSHTFEMQDVPALAALASQHGAVSVVDNTWATPLYFQPLRHGVDVVMHAATKYIGGHSDLLMGTLTANAAAWPQLRDALYEFGMTTSADDCWTALRGLRSMAARLAMHRANADRLVAWLQQQPEVDRVLYPPLPTDPGHALWVRDFSGASGLFGVGFRPAIAEAAVHALIDGVQLFGRGYSWGGFESLIIPTSPERTSMALPCPGRIIRIHAGMEDADDLIADLEQGFGELRAVAKAA